MGTAVGGNDKATVSWQAPLAVPAPIIAYVVTPWIGQTAQTPVRFNSTATTETIPGLTSGTTYTFTVVAINALNNDSASSAASNPVTIGPAATAISVGFGHSCVVLTGGTANCWGRNYYGELGNDTHTDSTTPVAVTGLASATAITASGGDITYFPEPSHTCARLNNGTVKCWGSGDNGVLGNGSTFASSTPVTVSGITSATAVAAGSLHTCAVLADGTVQCWGTGYFATCNEFFYCTTPVPIPGITTATAISAGYSHTCALVADGTIKCWGTNGYGQLGDGTTNDAIAPVTVTGISTAIAISAGDWHTCALLAGGTVKCWGALHNPHGQLGNGTSSGSTTPVTVTGISTAIAVAAGQFHTCAVLTGGTAKCWGGNEKGQLGDGATNDAHTPVTVTGLTSATAIDAGEGHTCALLVGGDVTCWGGDNYGQLGNATTTDSHIPIAVAWP